MSKDRLTDLLNLEDVKRWGRIPLYRPQSVAEHSFRVAAICMEIADQLGSTGYLAALLPWAILHDGPECETGDIPYVVKTPEIRRQLAAFEEKLCPWYPQLNSQISKAMNAIVKLADKIEEVIYLNKWGAPGSEEAYEMSYRLVRERTAAAATDFGWLLLPQIVFGILEAQLNPRTYNGCTTGSPRHSGEPNLKQINGEGAVDSVIDPAPGKE